MLINAKYRNAGLHRGDPHIKEVMADDKNIANDMIGMTYGKSYQRSLNEQSIIPKHNSN